MTPQPTEGAVTYSTYADVCRVLADPHFVVAPPGDKGNFGSIRWLRASASRFANGERHKERRVTVERELSLLDPDALRQRATELTCDLLDKAGHGGRPIDVMSLLARRVPVETLAEGLGFDRPGEAARAAVIVSASYLGGPTPDTEAVTDRAVAKLNELAEASDPARLVARLTLLAQACDATAGLIGRALIAYRNATEEQTSAWTVDQVIAEVLRHSPPLVTIRRRTRPDPDPGGLVVLCDLERANRDPEVFDRPDDFDPLARRAEHLTFGFGIRPCPGREHATALAAGVVDGVISKCRLLPSADVEYEPSAALRIPQRLQVEFDG